MTTLVDIKGYIGQSETLRLEFKDARGVGRLDDVARQVTAMANTRGGRIIYGLGEKKPKGTAMSIATDLRPIADPSACADRASSYIAQRVSPTLPRCEVIAILADATRSDSDGYVVIEVGESIRGHASCDGHFYRRHSYGVHALDERELRELLALSNRADLDLVGVLPGTYQAADLTGSGQTVVGVRNCGNAAEVLYRVTLEFENVDLLPNVYDPTGNRDFDGLLKQYGNRYVFTGTERCAVFPEDLVPILQLAYHGRASWRGDSRILWSITGANTRNRTGALAVGV